MKLLLCFCHIIMYCIICGEYFLNIVTESIKFKEKERSSYHDITQNKDFNYENNNPLIREKRNIKCTEGNEYFNFLNFNQNNKSNQAPYKLNFMNENKYRKSLIPETFNSVDPNVTLHGYEMNMPLLNESLKKFQDDGIGKDSPNIKSHNNFDLNLNELNNIGDLVNYYPSYRGLINNAEEIFDKSPFYESNLYVNSVKKPLRNVTESNIKNNEDRYLQKNETNNINDLLRMFLSNNLDNVSDDLQKNEMNHVDDLLQMYLLKNSENINGDENKWLFDKILEQQAKLTATNSQEKINNLNNVLNSSQINTNLFENILSNLKKKILQDNNSLLQSDVSNITDNNFETVMNSSSSNLGISNEGVVPKEMIQKNYTDQKNFTNEFSLQNLKNIENLSNENTIDKKINNDDNKNDNYDNFFQELQKNFTRMKLARAHGLIPDYDSNNYHTGSLRPQFVLRDDLTGNVNFRNMFSDNIMSHRNDNKILEYIASNNEHNQKKFTKSNSGINSSANLGNFVATNFNKTSSYDISTLNPVTYGITYGSYIVNHSDEILKGFLPSPPSNTKVNIKDPKLIENLRKIDLSILSYPPAFNYGIPINKPKRMFIPQKINKRSFPIVTLHFENESYKNKSNNTPSINDNNFPLTVNLSASLLPGILLRSDQLDQDTFEILKNNLLKIISNYVNNSSNKDFHNDNDKTFIIGNNSNDQLYLTKPEVKLFNSVDSKPTKINFSNKLNLSPDSLIPLNEPPNITHEEHNDSNFIKMTDLEKGLKELVNISSGNIQENLAEVSTTKLYHQSNFQMDDFVQNAKNKSKYGKTDDDKVDVNGDKNISSSDIVTERNENQRYTDSPEFKQVTPLEGEHYRNTDVILRKNFSNISVNIPSKDQIAHVKLVGFVLEKNNSDKSNEMNDDNNVLPSDQVFKKASSYEPINRDIYVDKFHSKFTKPNKLDDSNFNQNNLTDYQKNNMSSFSELLNITDAKLIEKLISILQKNLDNQTKPKNISVK